MYIVVSCLNSAEPATIRECLLIQHMDMSACETLTDPHVNMGGSKCGVSLFSLFCFVFGISEPSLLLN